jgi:hypothetical protein
MKRESSSQIDDTPTEALTAAIGLHEITVYLEALANLLDQSNGKQISKNHERSTQLAQSIHTQTATGLAEMVNELFDQSSTSERENIFINLNRIRKTGKAQLNQIIQEQHEIHGPVEDISNDR